MLVTLQCTACYTLLARTLSVLGHMPHKVHLFQTYYINIHGMLYGVSEPVVNVY